MSFIQIVPKEQCRQGIGIISNTLSEIYCIGCHQPMYWDLDRHYCFTDGCNYKTTWCCAMNEITGGKIHNTHCLKIRK